MNNKEKKREWELGEHYNAPTIMYNGETYMLVYSDTCPMVTFPDGKGYVAESRLVVMGRRFRNRGWHYPPHKDQARIDYLRVWGIKNKLNYGRY